ncbi:hypothetical protein MAPG_06023 [Magnaporthiopsis poae ATCC 64411]|uniref:Uncharacterized protein n=1 Tax=Magnaporthiopsis poae (strain ATCC 64411 / 73-15) TaxID=644358 RepID=A0A0C4E0Y1_MAGP6|nr:hypothetical protein MAPG_06023 [Magnaporthiopsis poae ATCC 64411]
MNRSARLDARSIPRGTRTMTSSPPLLHTIDKDEGHFARRMAIILTDDDDSTEGRPRNPKIERELAPLQLSIYFLVVVPPSRFLSFSWTGCAAPAKRLGPDLPCERENWKCRGPVKPTKQPLAGRDYPPVERKEKRFAEHLTNLVAS